MTRGSIRRRATWEIPGLLGRKITPPQLDGPMRGRPLRPAKAFGIGPGNAGARRWPGLNMARPRFLAWLNEASTGEREPSTELKYAVDTSFNGVFFYGGAA
jgi:hypothetical protein